MRILYLLASLLIIEAAYAGQAPPLFKAVYKNDIQTVKKYIKSGGDINIRRPMRNSSAPGDSLLLATIDNSRYEMVLLLLQANVSIGMKEVRHALARGEGKIFKLFYPHINTLNNNDLDYLLLIASQSSFKGYAEIVKHLISLGADPTKTIKSEMCEKTAIGQVILTKSNPWAKDADIILNILINTASKSKNVSSDMILKTYGHHCSGYE